MDQARQIRFLIPPLLLFTSFLWGLYLDSCRDFSDFLPTDWSTKEVGGIIGIITGGSIFVVALGFIIGTVSIVISRLFVVICPLWLLQVILGFPPARVRHYEAVVSEQGLRAIWNQLRINLAFDVRQTFYAVVTFDHDLLRGQAQGIHEWLLRRWTSFNISIHSSIGLVFLLACGIWFLGWEWKWWLPNLIAVIFLIVNGIISWRETMRMIFFQSFRDIRQ